MGISRYYEREKYDWRAQYEISERIFKNPLFQELRYIF